ARGGSRRPARRRTDRSGAYYRPGRLARPTMLQGHPELRTAPVDSAAHGPQLHPEGAGDLLVGQALDVTEHDGGAVLRRQRGECLLHIAVEMPGVERLGRGRLIAAQPASGVVAKTLEADPLPAPGHVKEKVRGDPVQPPLEGARGVARQRPEDPDEHLLGEVL